MSKDGPPISSNGYRLGAMRRYEWDRVLYIKFNNPPLADQVTEHWIT